MSQPLTLDMPAAFGTDGDDIRSVIARISLDAPLSTKSSDAKAACDRSCLLQLSKLVALILKQDVDTEKGLLHRKHHQAFIDGWFGVLPAAFTGLDASRPWVGYWCLNALATMGVDVSIYRPELIAFLRPIQNDSGGFGGGQGQYSHLATTYAATLSLALVGGEEALALIDRKAMWEWLGSLKEADGSFRMSADAEADTRSAYCVFTVLSLLQLPLELPPTATRARAAGLTVFSDRLLEWIGSCQSYEGGIASVPGAEAHGAYTFCALACLCLIDLPHRILPRVFNLPKLIRWLAYRQDGPTGGLAGRTNKLVDGCYSTWIGGCFALVEAALDQEQSTLPVWEPNGLLQYIYGCAQEVKPSTGGLADKPTTRPDAYHTNYNLLGLASAQQYQHIAQASEHPAFAWVASTRSSAHEHRNFDKYFRNPADDLVMMSPVFAIPLAAVANTRLYFAERPLEKPV